MAGPLSTAVNMFIFRVQSRNEFFGGKMVSGKCALGRGSGASPQESVSVLLSKHIYSSVFTVRQGLTLCHYFKLQLGKLLRGKLECLEEKLPPTHPSRLKPDIINVHAHYLHLNCSIAPLCPLRCC